MSHWPAASVTTAVLTVLTDDLYLYINTRTFYSAGHILELQRRGLAMAQRSKDHSCRLVLVAWSLTVHSGHITVAKVKLPLKYRPPPRPVALWREAGPARASALTFCWTRSRTHLTPTFLSGTWQGDSGKIISATQLREHYPPLWRAIQRIVFMGSGMHELGAICCSWR